MPLCDVIVWINTTSTEDQRLLLHRCLFSPAYWFVHLVYITKEANAGLCRNQKKRLPKKCLCIAFLLNLTLGKNGWNLFLMKIQTVPVRTWSFVRFILPWILLQKKHNSMQDFQKDDAVSTILDQTVMLYHTSVLLCLLSLIDWYELGIYAFLT